MADERTCARCALKNVVRIVTVYLRDARAAEMNGQWSKAEKKALKVEAKGLLKEVKRDIKQTWKAKP